MGSPVASTSDIRRRRPTPDPIRGTPQAMVPVGEVLVDNPPDSQSPSDWVVAESVCIAMLRKHYGWISGAPGHLIRTRPPAEYVPHTMLDASPEAHAS